jgi:hypothetical protein
LVTEAETRKPLLIACMLVVIQQLSGINAVRISVENLSHRRQRLVLNTRSSRVT